MLTLLPIDILQYIVDQCTLSQQYSIIQTCNTFYTHLSITNFNVFSHQTCRISDKILEKYKHIKKLNLSTNINITPSSLLNLKNIKLLNISQTNINYDAIKHLDLVELDISNNNNFFDITTFPNLRILHIIGMCDISYNQLGNIPSLEVIFANYNPQLNIIMDSVSNTKIVVYS